MTKPTKRRFSGLVPSLLLLLIGGFIGRATHMLSDIGQPPPRFVTIDDGQANQAPPPRLLADDAPSTNQTQGAWPGDLDHLVDGNNVIVVVTVTCPYIHMLDNLIESMRRVNVTNVAMVPLDEGAARVLKAMYGSDDMYRMGQVLDIPPFVTTQDSYSKKAANYDESAFRHIVSWRPRVMRAFLEQNYTVFYTDTDTYWRSNPLDFLHRSATERKSDLAPPSMVVETFNFPMHPSLQENVNEAFDMVAMFDSGKTNVCTGYMYMQPTQPSIQAMNQWAKNILAAKVSYNQPAFELVFTQSARRSRMMQNMSAKNSIPSKVALPGQASSSSALLARMQQNMLTNKDKNLKSRVYIDTNKYFPSGKAYDTMLSEDARQNVLMVHGNFIIGMGNKAAALEKWGVWKPSGRLPQFSSQCTAGVGSA